MAHERSTEITHRENGDQKKYDWAYYNALSPYIKGVVLDIGSGAGMFVKEYVNKPEVEMVICMDKFTEQLPTHEKITAIETKLPEGIMADRKYDTIVCTEFIEHITREEGDVLLQKVKDSLKEDGVFLGSTPNKISPTTNPYHLYEYTLDELKGILEQYFTKVEAWDNGFYCTLWKVSL